MEILYFNLELNETPLPEIKSENGSDTSQSKNMTFKYDFFK